MLIWYFLKYCNKYQMKQLLHLLSFDFLKVMNAENSSF